jgi:hypothetical protein
MPQLAYTVAVTFAEPSLAAQWLRWLREGHIADVLAAGATCAEVVRLDGSDHSYEVRYRFPSRAAFAAYERDAAPRLRAEGLRLFPVDKGITYRRTAGLIVDSF